MNILDKNNPIAKKLRIEANVFYQNGEYYDALVKYNKSLCYALIGSEDMAFAYANRSAVYFELKYYDKAISNIQKALENNYPDEKKKTLLDRKEKAEKLIGTMPQKKDKGKVTDVYKLSYDPNPKYPSFADCIELRSNDKYGRYLVTNRDLKIGDIIAIEDFLYYSINDKYSALAKRKGTIRILCNYEICAFCHKSNLLDLQPCKQCVYTMYCSKNCRIADLHQVHCIECLLMPLFITGPTYHSVFRSFFMALSICNYSIDELKELIEEVEKFDKHITVFDFDFSKMSESKKKKKLIQIMYCGHRKNTGFSEDMIDAILGCHPKTKVMLEKNKEFIVKFITRLYEVQAVNCFDYTKKMPKLGDWKMTPGDCMYPGLSLFNFSCVPNVYTVHMQKKLAMVVLRKIKKGEQIFSYCGANYMDEEKTVRQVLHKYYGYKCECIACKKKLPKFEFCREDGLMFEQANHDLEAIEKLISDNEMTPTLAKKFIKKHCNILNEFYPSDSYGKDYHLLTKCVTSCLNIIAAYLQESSLEKIP